MPELLFEYAVARFRPMTAAAVCTLALCAIPASAWAQSVPAGLRACAAESDPGQRLDCYDREMKRLMAAAAQAAPSARPAQAAEAAPPAAATASAPPPAPASTATDAAPSSGARAPATAVSTPAPAKATQEPQTPHHSGVWKLFSGGAPSRMTARIVRVDRSPGAMVLHLDNGQVWRQTGRAPGDLGLRAGDEVTIEQHLGSYWLSSSHVSDMRVRQESR
ncbi:MAG TPA: hypothetical protein VFN79_12685 [Steroidobacteraceae bacterium]|nr:hypothetical protein [Steroidobacteraceae bacterium]